MIKDILIVIIPIIISTAALVVSILALRHQIPDVKIETGPMIYGSTSYWDIQTYEKNKGFYDDFAEMTGDIVLKCLLERRNKNDYDWRDAIPDKIARVHIMLLNKSSSPITVANMRLHKGHISCNLNEKLSGLLLPVVLRPYDIMDINAVFDIESHFYVKSSQKVRVSIKTILGTREKIVVRALKSPDA